MTQTTDTAGSVVLAPEECVRLVTYRRPRLARVAVLDDGLPIALPVNYCIDGGSLVFRTRDGSVLHRAARAGAVASAQVDEVDETWQEGWSVLVKGHLVDITEDGDPQRLRELPLQPWSSGPKGRYVQLVSHDISGRRIT
jgi:uncharacterized protein